MHCLARWITAFVLLATPSAALGQEPEPPSAATPRVEVGVDGGALMLLVFPVAAEVTARASVALAERYAAEGLFEFVPTESHGGVAGLYRVQVRYRLGASSPAPNRAQTFLTFGATGLFRHSSWPERRWTDRAGRTHVDAGGSLTDSYPPILPTAGFGAQKALASHLWFRAEVTFIALVVIRPTVGVSIPIGH